MLKIERIEEIRASLTAIRIYRWQNCKLILETMLFEISMGAETAHILSNSINRVVNLFFDLLTRRIFKLIFRQTALLKNLFAV